MMGYSHSDRIRIHDRQINEMLGMLRGIVCDGVVTEDEVHAFTHWLARHPDCVDTWPGNVLAVRLQRIIDAGTVSPGDRLELYDLFSDTLGHGDMSRGLPPIYATRLPFDDPPPALTFPGTTFCFTGAFIFGERTFCMQAVEQRGGICRDSVIRKPMTLVIGGYGNDAWAHSSYGRKIEKAMEYRAHGVAIPIVSEEHWTEAVMATPPA